MTAILSAPTATTPTTDDRGRVRVLGGRGLGSPSGPTPDADRPPVCPVCNKRLVILTSRSGRDAAGNVVRRQLWGCPRGHATATYAGGGFGPIELLPTYEDPEE